MVCLSANSTSFLIQNPMLAGRPDPIFLAAYHLIMKKLLHSMWNQTKTHHTGWEIGCNECRIALLLKTKHKRMHLTTRGWITPALQWQWQWCEQWNNPWVIGSFCVKARTIIHNSMPPHSHMNAHAQAHPLLWWNQNWREPDCDLLGSRHWYGIQRFQSQHWLLVCVVHQHWCQLMMINPGKA